MASWIARNGTIMTLDDAIARNLAGTTYLSYLPTLGCFNCRFFKLINPMDVFAVCILLVKSVLDGE